MPLYDYECENGHEFTGFRKIAERNSGTCPRCGSQARVVIKKPPGAVLFRAGWYEHLDLQPVWCETAQQLRDECDIRGKRSTYLENSSFRVEDRRSAEAEDARETRREKGESFPGEGEYFTPAGGEEAAS